MIEAYTCFSQNRTFQSQNKQAWRYMLPFFLLVCVVLLLVFRLLYSGSASASIHCAENEDVYRVSKGDTCWQIATNGKMTVEELQKVNAGLDCARLGVGSELCVPRRDV